MNNSQAYIVVGHETARYTYMSVNCAKLPSPLGVVKEGPMVEAVIIGAVRLGVDGRRNHRHFMSVDGVAAIKMFDLEIETLLVLNFHFFFFFLFIKETSYTLCAISAGVPAPLQL